MTKRYRTTVPSIVLHVDCFNSKPALEMMPDVNFMSHKNKLHVNND